MLLLLRPCRRAWYLIRRRSLSWWTTPRRCAPRNAKSSRSASLFPPRAPCAPSSRPAYPPQIALHTPFCAMLTGGVWHLTCCAGVCHNYIYD